MTATDFKGVGVCCTETRLWTDGNYMYLECPHGKYQMVIRRQPRPKPDWKDKNEINFGTTSHINLPPPPLVTVEINGVAYIPRDTVIPNEIMDDLNQLYGRIWGEGYYDAFNEASKKFAIELWPYIKRVNTVLRFKK